MRAFCVRSEGPACRMERPAAARKVTAVCRRAARGLRLLHAFVQSSGNRRRCRDYGLRRTLRGGRRTRKHLRRAIPSGEVRPGRLGDTEELLRGVMLTKRIIACLDVTAGRVVKGVKFEQLRDAGDPAELAFLHAEGGADEIVLLDITATHEARPILIDVVRRTARELFVPFTVGGGVR